MKDDETRQKNPRKKIRSFGEDEGYVVAYFEESYYAYYLSAGYLSVEEIKRMIESMSL